MKCQICQKKITWTNSYGRTTFLICHSCFEQLHKYYGWKTLDFICDIGLMIENREETNND